MTRSLPPRQLQKPTAGSEFPPVKSMLGSLSPGLRARLMSSGTFIMTIAGWAVQTSCSSLLTSFSSLPPSSLATLK
eukprot:3717837-Lingulodinium_polyedra.AAC.1